MHDKKLLTFIETLAFTNSWQRFASSEELDKVIEELLAQPDAGDVIPDTGGLRKLRCGANSKGKKGGGRVIYFKKIEDGVIYLLLAYPKAEMKNLSSTQKKTLSALAAQL